MITLCNIVIIIKKELRSFLNTFIAYIGVTFFLLTSSVWFFYIHNFYFHNRASMEEFFSLFPYLLIFIIPSFTMKSWSEEIKMGTDVLLLTSPMSEAEIVIGKYFSVLIVIIITLSLTLPIPFMLSILGNFDKGVIIAQYLGSLLLASAAISVGLTLSLLSKSQVISFLVTALVLLSVAVMDRVILFTQLPDYLFTFLHFISLNYHYHNILRGIIDTRTICYFLCLTFFFLYLNIKIIILRKYG